MYPSYLEDDERWLDGTGGANSVRAATLRSADAAGLARGSDWCPGSSVGEREGRGTAVAMPVPGAAAFSMEHAADQSAATSATEHSANEGHLDGGAAASHAGTPRDAGAVRGQDTVAERGMANSGRGRRRQPWRVEATEEGLLRGCPQPAPSARVADMLAAVLDGGHQLSEAEMVLLFAARGADFQVGCVAHSALPSKQYTRCCLCQTVSPHRSQLCMHMSAEPPVA